MKFKNYILKYFILFCLVFSAVFADAQGPTDDDPMDPGRISITVIQNMSFGAFTQGTIGGAVNITTGGFRSITGDLVGLNLGIPYMPAMFDILAPEGTIISILYGPDVTLTGSNGGTMTLKLNSSDPVSPFSTTVAPPGQTRVKIGGTLTVGNTTVSKPGSYSGTFSITFNQE